ncbi:hypothetical protein ACFQJD_17725 [Haloplanus sp. GCM10025708]|uniref:hypothetical protein n=1 Tax=Haloplanus sp. GCM10025708 TaxID=3252679 RepID=UPI00361B5A6C
MGPHVPKEVLEQRPQPLVVGPNRRRRHREITGVVAGRRPRFASDATQVDGLRLADGPPLLRQRQQLLDEPTHPFVRLGHLRERVAVGVGALPCDRELPRASCNGFRRSWETTSTNSSSCSVFRSSRCSRATRRETSRKTP